MSRLIHEAFGPHLVLTGAGAPPELLRDLGAVHRFLEEMPAAIGMTAITPPFCYQFRQGGLGVSGLVLIAESHISLHTWPERTALTLDIFSCREFAVNLAVARVAEAFRLREWIHQVFDRGLEFGRDVPGALHHLRRERRAWCGGGG